MKEQSKDMTQGGTLKVILLFAIPILFGNLLQQTYNLVDSIVVGQYVGTDAFGATSASNTLINLFISVLIGIGSGASIIISQLFGRKIFDSLKKAFSTALIAMSICTIVISIIGFFFSRQLLILLKVDPLILEDANTYLKIIFVGLFPMMLFNMYSAFLRGIGNSTMPLVFLVVATISNIALDVLFVAVFNMGVMGVAVATSIANFIAAVGIIIYTNRKIPYFSLKKGDFKFDIKLLKKVFIAGFPVIFQSVLVSVSLVLLQSIFNGYGKDYTAAYGLSGRIDAIVCLPLNSIAMALSTFVAQNKGAGNSKRITEGFWKSIVAMTIITTVSIVLTLIYIEPIISVFIKVDEMQTSATVIQVTREFFEILGPFYFLMGVMFMTSNSLAGASDVKSPIIIMSISMVIRTILAYALQPSMGYLAGMWAFPISWFVGAVLGAIQFCRGKWKTKSFLEDEKTDLISEIE